jgi:CheY-like chemotaxis protein
VAVVLVTEDEPVVRAFARFIVHEAGHQSLAASNVDEALALLTSAQPIDILFTDINLRPFAHGGLKLARKAVELRPELRVIYTTGRHLTDEMKTMFADGAPLLLKPYTPDELTEVLSKLVAAKDAVGPPREQTGGSTTP